MRTRVLLTILATGCSTLAETAGGDSNLPSSDGGPFRKLQGAEAHGAPYVLDDQTSNYRQPSALPIDDTELALYVVAHDKTSDKDVIARSHALDGRTFFGATQDFGHKPPIVLADPAADLSHPSALRAPDGIRLYYTKNGAVGLARSQDGLVFTDGPAVFAGPVDSASVALLPDGTFRMLFGRAGAIFEATSADGTSFDAAPDPVLTAGTTFDALGVSDPYLYPRMTPANRLQFRVLYTGTMAGDDATVTTSILFAARYEDSGPFVRATTPAYAVGKNERAPTVLEWDSGTFLYVDQDQSAESTTYRAIACGVAPAAITLSPPSDFPDTP
jgi:hypothetical protein